jgi:excisionase family DNA binding protein
MAQKYYNVKETAEILGISEDAVKLMLEHRELYGYRDGADWKFKTEDIERKAADQKAAAAPTPAIEDTDDVLLSEVELGQSGLGASGTVIGMEGAPRAESDINLTGSDIQPSSQSVTPPIAKAQSDSKVGKFEDLELSMEEDLTLAESNVGLDAIKKPSADSPTGGSSLVTDHKESEDDEAVIGGSSSSGITLSGDSGISLVDPADSGLSLEEPLELGGSVADQSLELGEEDILQLAESSKSHSGITADDDFLLTPTEETAEPDESESGSQVIALDTEGDDAATLVAPGGAMFGENLAGHPALDMGAGVSVAAAPLGGPGVGVSPTAMAEGPAVIPAFFEAPYSTWNIVSLSLCLLLMLFCGAMVYDVLRNMWSWNSAGSVNTWLMDTILRLFEK